MLGFLKSKSEIVAPVSGRCISITEVGDKVFSTKMMGDGFAVIPNDDLIVSPIDGNIVMIPASKHAVGLKTRDGIEILIHVGLDTVMLEGKGFEVLCKQGSNVKAGDPLLRIDINQLKEMNIDLTTIVVFTSGYNKEVKLDCFQEIVEHGEVLIK